MYVKHALLQVKNLRSTVARGAIACLGDMFATMQRAMEQVTQFKINVQVNFFFAAVYHDHAYMCYSVAHNHLVQCNYM